MVGCKDFPSIERSASSFHVLAMHSCYSMNNICQGYSIQKIIPFHPSWPATLSSSQIGYHFCDRNLLNNVCFLNPSMYESVKRNKTLKNPHKKSL